MDHETAVGERIAYYRRRRGLTQEVLSGRVGRSAVWLSKIERGERTLDKISLLLALARVLEVEPGDLIGGLELPPNGGTPHDHPQGIPAIRRAVVGTRPPDIEPPIAAQLRRDFECAATLGANGSLEKLGSVLPDLLLASRAAVAEGVPGAWWCLAGAYREAGGWARATGDMELALIAADRAVTAAERSGDELLVGAAERQVVNALMRLGRFDEAGSVYSDAVDALAPTHTTPRAGWSIWGVLHLQQSVVAVPAGDVAEAWRVLRDARVAAEHVGAGHNDYWEAFGPAWVTAHEIWVALDSGDAVEALRIADTFDVEELPTPERRARVLLSVAHAHALRRDDAAAVAILLEAERHAPEVVRHQALAHEIVRTLLHRERRSRTPELRGLAQRLGIAD
ncbi:MAG: helix-turn-helix domain-containing protein [Egibacteraceae bacterium]